MSYTLVKFQDILKSENLPGPNQKYVIVSAESLPKGVSDGNQWENMSPDYEKYHKLPQVEGAGLIIKVHGCKTKFINLVARRQLKLHSCYTKAVKTVWPELQD
ncbi:hypothetical protein IJU97_03065 [bacterium]|nr:hypothetical protein [bacterium]